jgi:hypothetical protein
MSKLNFFKLKFPSKVDYKIINIELEFSDFFYSNLKSVTK